MDEWTNETGHDREDDGNCARNRHITSRRVLDRRCGSTMNEQTHPPVARDLACSGDSGGLSELGREGGEDPGPGGIELDFPVRMDRTGE